MNVKHHVSFILFAPTFTRLYLFNLDISREIPFRLLDVDVLLDILVFQV